MTMEQLASEYNISTLVTPSQVYLADQIMLKYYTAPILNAIKTKINAMKNRSSKHFTFEHWASVLDAIFAGNSSVRREDNIIQVFDCDNSHLQSFILITTKYLVTDYGTMDSKLIYNIINTYTEQQIKDAVSTAKANNVYNIQYVNAILEKEQALSNMKKLEQQRLRDKINNSNSILDRQKVEHSPIEMAVSQYNWEQAKQNAELEKMFNEKFGR